MDARAGHGFQPASAGDSRSPCPALNAAANHSYLPHSGKDIGIWQLTQALHDLYALSYPLALFLSLGGILICGTWGKLDLSQLSKHNRIEHDASLVHVDYSEGDYTQVSPPLVEELVAYATDGRGLTMSDFAKARARRELRPTVKIDALHTRIARGESALSVMVMGHGQAMPVDAARTWFGEERLPKGWEPRGKLGLLQFAGINRSFDTMVEEVKVKLSEKRAD